VVDGAELYLDWLDRELNKEPAGQTD